LTRFHLKRARARSRRPRLPFPRHGPNPRERLYKSSADEYLCPNRGSSPLEGYLSPPPRGHSFTTICSRTVEITLRCGLDASRPPVSAINRHRCDAKISAIRPVAFSLSSLAESVQFCDFIPVLLFLLLVSLRARLVIQLPQFLFFCSVVRQLRRKIAPA